HQYLQTKTDAELAEDFLAVIVNLPNNVVVNLKNKEYIQKAISLVKERATFVSDFWELGSFFFEAPLEYDEKASKKQWKDNTNEIMSELVIYLNTINDFSAENTETKVKEWIEAKGYSFGQVMPPLRLALVGEMKGPHVFDIISLIGKEETITRIKKAVQVLG